MVGTTESEPTPSSALRRLWPAYRPIGKFRFIGSILYDVHSFLLRYYLVPIDYFNTLICEIIVNNLSFYITKVSDSFKFMSISPTECQ